MTKNQSNRRGPSGSNKGGDEEAAPGCLSGLRKLLASLARRMCGRRRKSRSSARKQGVEEEVEAQPSAGCHQDCLSPTQAQDGHQQGTCVGSLPRAPLASPEEFSDLEPSPSSSVGYSVIPFIDSHEESLPTGELLEDSPQDLVIYLKDLFFLSEQPHNFLNVHSSATDSPKNSPEHHNTFQAGQDAPADTDSVTASSGSVCVDPANEAVEPINTSVDRLSTPEPPQQEGKDAEGWQLVCRKKSKRKEKKRLCETQTQTSKAVAASVAQGGKKRAKENGRRQHRPRRHDSSERVRLSWAEETVRTVLQVPPNRRQHVIGQSGEAILKLRQDYPAVRVTVPPTRDLDSRDVTLEGPKNQVAAAARDITSRLAAIEAQLQGAAARRRAEFRRGIARRLAEEHEVLVQVAPHMRRHVVGHGGKALRSLAQEYPAVRVTVPPPSDTKTGTVIVSGPPAEVEAVQRRIAARLQTRLRPRHLRRCTSVPGSVAAAALAP